MSSYVETFELYACGDYIDHAQLRRAVTYAINRVMHEYFVHRIIEFLYGILPTGFLGSNIVITAERGGLRTVFTVKVANCSMKQAAHVFKFVHNNIVNALLENQNKCMFKMFDGVFVISPAMVLEYVSGVDINGTRYLELTTCSQGQAWDSREEIWSWDKDAQDAQESQAFVDDLLKDKEKKASKTKKKVKTPPKKLLKQEQRQNLHMDYMTEVCR